LFGNPRRFLAADAVDWCIRHKDFCRVNEPVQVCDVVAEDGNAQWEDQLVEVHSQSGGMCSDDPVETTTQNDVVQEGMRTPKQKKKTKRKARTQRQEVTLTTGGTTCTDHSAYGSQQQESGQSMKAFNAFCLDILANEPHHFLTEISNATMEYYRSRLGKKYYIVGMEIDAGFIDGERRVGLYCWGSHWLKVRYHGSPEMFQTIFRRHRCLNGKAYFVDTPKATQN